MRVNKLMHGILQSIFLFSKLNVNSLSPGRFVSCLNGLGSNVSIRSWTVDEWLEKRIGSLTISVRLNFIRMTRNLLSNGVEATPGGQPMRGKWEVAECN